MVMQKVQEKTGWQIIVDNKPGANRCSAPISRAAAPDGYTFLTVIAAHAAVPTPARAACHSTWSRAAPVSLVGIAPLIMTASNGFPPKDARSFIAYAKATPPARFLVRLFWHGAASTPDH
jgi:tripartite-type tricarboxylate transporter receptor subunit TctC